MIKILHFADLHLGMENYGKIDPESGLSSRFLDFVKCFEEIIKFAKEQKVDLVIFAGDAYKTRDPSPTFQRAFAKEIYKLSQLNIPTVLLVGNHDLPTSLGKANTLDIFYTLKINNVYVSRQPEILEIPIRHQPGKIQVLTLPWITKNLFLSVELVHKSSKQLNEIILLKIKEKLKQLYAKINSKYPAILTAHASVEGATFGSEQQVTLGTDVVVPKSYLKNKHIQYVALGHLHKKQVLDENPLMVYCGSVDRVDFGEEKEDKGFCLVKIQLEKNNQTSFQFEKLPSRKFINIEININPEDADPTLTAVKEINKYQIKDAVVKVLINLTHEQFNQIVQSEIEKALSTAAFIASISKEARKEKINKMLYSDEIASLTPMQWVEKYLELKKDKKKEEVLDTAKKMFEEINL
ncbi:MAG: nuclease SbcCD subunit D [Candidatus Nealsonbacteria bacterium CG23_combo_of_CG06-09_8_20_14_all_40_13]|uniref:Nuclease SbcCD subunit D n=1 Tax=Candidatus Nealsonbacteria bacterium CG23_combo_of_CG06-09_8_20_14_all_40_13 TaxID=1974724 RepID=A0A2G9YTM7_9BACT|nr:MAG: nuclease SbcCD subunit D [Candidatus Nealsonbacteria bacterium CG23_combo_of_CG06-09_8_20_14_all_40_13]PIR70986.1 MAG: exonuclease SbcCD subunit D [Candidatus Nealsonbacteria bacterium CG10_big_fil_rev_8_21_14_0_10_40_24]PIU43352.1 MAG: exonuclease SbcCD subunit D [Candidatus Nealsonbacteria bacterium CG07_land_8_20_14_0_80_40_10]